MTNLLLITDVPRLRKIFNRLGDDTDVALRTVASLEKGGEEIIKDKPDVVFVQTHLSGISADILLMHLKKQLGRKRSRFVLLSTPSQVSADVIKLFHGHIDTSLDEKGMSNALRTTLATFFPKKQWGVEVAAAPPVKEGSAPTPPPVQAAPDISPSEPAVDRMPVVQAPVPPVQPEAPVQERPAPVGGDAEPSLEEQGITYSPRSRVKVYSEFTSSFDSAAASLADPEPPVDEPPPPRITAWDLEHMETIEEPKKKLPKRIAFLLWLAPVLIAVVAVTYLQHRKPAQKPVDVAAVPQQQKGAIAPQPTAPAVVPAPAVDPARPAAPAAPQAVQPAAPQAAKVPAEPGDKAVLSAIEANRPRTEAPAPAPTGPRLTKLPDVVPRYGFDKAYGAANPGWERYKGQVTEFKVFREKEFIKTIQVIDRGGNGVPESFMKAVLRQVAKNPAFVLESSEKKEGYEIQRGHITGNLKVVFYRDEQGGRLRAFVMTWL